MDKNAIPPITDPLGRHWEQPPTAGILIDDTHAVMGEATFRELKDCSATSPSGVYPGKMWRANVGGKWWLRWYGQHENPKLCTNNQREILVVV